MDISAVFTKGLPGNRRIRGALRLLLGRRSGATGDSDALKRAGFGRERDMQRHRAQLTRLARVALAGELAGALAHELNQPLATILANAQAGRRFLARAPADLDQVRAILDDIVDEAMRTRDLVRGLRALFMHGEPALQPLDINDLVRDALALARGVLAEREVRVSLAPGAGARMEAGDRVQLQQVLLNLIVNACEAMSCKAPEGRCLRVATGVGPQGSVQVEVTDSGPGIAADALGQVFDAFFSTKAGGLGLGLSLARAIVQAHGGRIAASNAPGGGATLHITLPQRAGGQA
jgi:signal transduction histidine kinase